MSKKATIEHNIDLLEKQIAKKATELLKLRREAGLEPDLSAEALEKMLVDTHVTEAVLKEQEEIMKTETVKTETVTTESKKSLRATIVSWLSAAWSAVKSFTGSVWENAATAFVDVVFNPVAAQVAFGASLLYGIAEAAWMLAGEPTAIAAVPFVVLIDTITYGFAALGLAVLGVFAKNTIGDWAVAMWNGTRSLARSSWNWVSSPFRKAEVVKTDEPKVETKVETVKAEDDGVDHKRAEAVKNVKRVPDVTGGAVPVAA